MSIIDIHKATKESIPRPTREDLTEVTEQIWRYSNEHVHDLKKGNTADNFFASALIVSSNNIKAMIMLSSVYSSEVGCIFRNLVETCVDFFWVASYLENEPLKGERLAENFFLYGKFKFANDASAFAKLAKTDLFL